MKRFRSAPHPFDEEAFVWLIKGRKGDLSEKFKRSGVSWIFVRVSVWLCWV